MSNLYVAAAQTIPQAGNWAANLDQHVKLAQLAANKGIGLLIFPELSLIGYELDLLDSHAIEINSSRLDDLHKIAQTSKMTLVVGASLRATDQTKPYIASLLLHPTGERTSYAKHFLHSGEEKFAQAGPVGHTIYSMGSQSVALAICADTTHAAHPALAASKGAQIYAASVLWSINGYAVDAAMMQGYAQAHRMNVLVANYAGTSGGYDCAGASALWGADGSLIAQAPDKVCGLLCGELVQGKWQTSWIAAESQPT